MVMVPKFIPKPFHNQRFLLKTVPDTKAIFKPWPFEQAHLPRKTVRTPPIPSSVLPGHCVLSLCVNCLNWLYLYCTHVITILLTVSVVIFPACRCVVCPALLFELWLMLHCPCCLKFSVLLIKTPCLLICIWVLSLAELWQEYKNRM